MTNIDQRALTQAERRDWLRLIRSENVGPVTFHRLVERYGSAGAAIEALPELARRGGRAKPILVASKASAEAEIAAHERNGAVLIASVEPGYPAAMRGLDDAPPLLSVYGNAHLLTRPAVAVVGARNASVNGRRIAQGIAAELGQAGLLVVSGMARGIDTAAHEGVLAGETPGATAAVMAGGVDHIYPPENDDLYRRIVAQGVAVSEMPPGTVPQASHFPRRNRIISGISLGVVVVEASPRSGSLITARLALEQGREVFAVPGSPLDPRCAGPNGLIRQGATLTETADDVLAVLADMLRRPAVEARPAKGFGGSAPPCDDEKAVAAARSVVLEALGPAPVAVDEIIRRCQLSPAVVSTVLLELELAGRLERHPGHRVSLLG
ncbi:MAG: DNA-protecting protein DprA [Alphaproteobacteria bacterium]|nr:DNA-protecting protein DprA [Alphaproteobacteria bacterium]